MDLRLSVESDLGYDRGYGQRVSYDGSGAGECIMSVKVLTKIEV